MKNTKGKHRYWNNSRNSPEWIISYTLIVIMCYILTAVWLGTILHYIYYKVFKKLVKNITEIRQWSALVEPAAKLTDKYDTGLQYADMSCRSDAQHGFHDLRRDKRLLTAQTPRSFAADRVPVSTIELLNCTGSLTTVTLYRLSRHYAWPNPE